MDANITFELRRGFGGAVVSSANPGKLINAISGGGREATGINYTHILDVDGSFDIRDGCLRGLNQATVSYGDGDEVRIPDSAGTIYVVVWVENIISPPGLPVPQTRLPIARHRRLARAITNQFPALA